MSIVASFSFYCCLCFSLLRQIADKSRPVPLVGTSLPMISYVLYFVPRPAKHAHAVVNLSPFSESSRPIGARRLLWRLTLSYTLLRFPHFIQSAAASVYRTFHWVELKRHRARLLLLKRSFICRSLMHSRHLMPTHIIRESTLEHSNFP